MHPLLLLYSLFFLHNIFSQLIAYDQQHNEKQKIYHRQNFCIYRNRHSGSLDLAHYLLSVGCEEVELVGVCTDICVISNALLIKAYLPEVKITVDSHCCAGTTPDNHAQALRAMAQCQIEIV